MGAIIDGRGGGNLGKTHGAIAGAADPGQQFNDRGPPVSTSEALGGTSDYFLPITGITARTISVSADAVVAIHRTATLSADAVVRTARSITTAADARVQTTRTATASADASVRTSRNISASADAKVQSTRSITSSADARVQVARTATTSADADVRAARSISSSADAVLQASRAAAASADAEIQATRTAASSTDASVSANLSTSTSADASVQAARSSTAFADASIESARSTSASADAYVSNILHPALTVVLDAIVRTVEAATTSADAVVQRASSATTAADAAVSARETVSASADAMIVSTRSITTMVDARVMAVGDVVTFGDAVVEVGRAIWTFADAYIDLPAAPSAPKYGAGFGRKPFSAKTKNIAPAVIATIQVYRDGVTAGNVIRFSAVYRRGDDVVDPPFPYATIFNGGESKTLTVANRGLRRDGTGVYSFEVVPRPPEVRIRFGSDPKSNDGYSEVSVPVEGASYAEGPPPMGRRVEMLDELEAAGVRMDRDNATDAYVRGAFNALTAQRGPKAVAAEAVRSAPDAKEAMRIEQIRMLRARGVHVSEVASDAFLAGAMAELNARSAREQRAARTKRKL